MKYKILENKKYNLNSIQEMVLSNRGIDNPKKYLSLTESDIIDYSKLDNIEIGAKLLLSTIEDKKDIIIVTDSDCDGFTSASILWQYIKAAFNTECRYYIHDSKEHGLSKDILPQIINDIKTNNVGLIIIPDAGTNDSDSCKEIKSLNCDVLILDHHDQEKINNYACIINPQISKNYENKFISGCGVVWQFLRQIDDINWTNYAEKYIDLVALSIISDSMDIRTYENRAILNLGLSNIQNNFFLALLDKTFYSTKGEITPISIGFYVVPLVNGLIRVGTFEEKELMFKAFCEIDQEFDYIKKDKTETKENIYTRVARLATNCKAKQDRQIEKGIEIVEKDIETNNRNKNKILFALATDELSKNFTGLVAMKLASKYNKPVVLLRNNGNDYYSGSIRNFGGSPLTNLKDFFASLNSFQFLAGHQNAHGCGLTKKQLIRAIEISNEKLSNYDFSPLNIIDFSFNQESLSTNFLNDIYCLRPYYGQNISEPLILLKNISLNSSQISFIGKEKKDSWKFIFSENKEIDIIKFKFDKADIISDRFQSEDFSWEGQDIVLDLIIKVDKNSFNGKDRWLLIVQDYCLVE